MTKIAAIDIGFSRIKILSGTKSKKNISIDEFRTIAFRNELLENVGHLKFDPVEFYRINIESILEILMAEIETLHPKTKYYFTFNSLYSDIYLKTIDAGNMKKLKYICEFYMDKIKGADSESNYQIINYDKASKTGEVLLFNYQVSPFENLLEIINQLGVHVEGVEFDALCLANALDNMTEFSDSTNLLIDFGSSKTTLITMKYQKIISLKILPVSLLNVWEKISKRNNVTLAVAENLMREESRVILPETPIFFLSKFFSKVCEDIQDLEEFDSIDQVFVSGGAMNSSHYITMLSDELSKKVMVFDPFSDSSTTNLTGYSAAYGLFIR